MSAAENNNKEPEVVAVAETPVETAASTAPAQNEGREGRRGGRDRNQGGRDSRGGRDADKSQFLERVVPINRVS